MIWFVLFNFKDFVNGDYKLSCYVVLRIFDFIKVILFFIYFVIGWELGYSFSCIFKK